MKAVIIAAGMGRRLAPMTRDLPKCLAVAWNGTTLFDEQLSTLRRCGISDIVVVRGYRGEAFPDADVRYYWNHDYADTNVLASLMAAREEIEGDCLILYSDIWFELEVVETLLSHDATVTAVVDRDWEKRYSGRTDHTVDEAETAVVGEQGKILQIGKLGTTTGVLGEFIGMTKLDGEGAKVLTSAYDRARERYGEGPFQRAAEFRQAYLTDLLQELIDAGTDIEPVTIRGGWQEIDTVQDFENLVRAWKTGRGT